MVSASAAAFCSASSAGMLSFSVATRAINSLARASSFCALAWPMALDASLRSANRS
jgi:hypothetical protein